MIFGAAVRPGGRPSRTLILRVEAAVAFGERFTAPLYIPTGGRGRFGPSEASVMATLLRERGVQDEGIVLEETASDTLSATFAVERLLRGYADGVPVYAASSLYHLPRCLALLRLMGVAARPALPPSVPAATRWWCRCYWWLRELPALPYDVAAALMRMTRGPR